MLLIVAFSVGYFYSKRKEQKEALVEEQQEDELEDIEPIFSDKKTLFQPSPKNIKR